MSPEEIIENTLGSAAKIRVLRILKKPGAGLVSVRQLARITSLNAVTLARTLRSLKSVGLVDYVQAGRSQLWRVVPSYATYIVSPLLDKTASLPSLPDLLKRLIDLAKPIPHDVAGIILFGSASSGESTPKSDIDLCLLLERGSRTLKVEGFSDKLRRKIFETIGMRVSIMFFSKPRLHLVKEPLRSNIRGGVSLYEKNSHSRSQSA